MRSHLLTRLLQVIPTIILVSILVFALQQLMPGDPALVLAGEERGDPVVLQQIRAELFLDRSLPEQYLRWIGGVLQGVAADEGALRRPDGEAQARPSTWSSEVTSWPQWR